MTLVGARLQQQDVNAATPQGCSRAGLHVSMTRGQRHVLLFR